jgi:NitT/TauT family transport system ATP-binding protein
MLRVEHLRRMYDVVEAITDLTFEVRAHEFVSIVGQSGCGKTTLLKCMCGLLAPTAGGVFLHGQPITRPLPMMAPVFQDYSRSLFPWMTVRQNVAFPLRHGKLDRRAAHAVVEAAADAVDLTHVLDRYPWQLSGGMQQRVAIARAIAYRPQILLMDEPFASVDAQTRTGLQDLILRIRQQYGMTVVHVTHDIDEAVYLRDRILILTPAPGTLQQALNVDLPHPRDQLATRARPEFTRLRALVYRSITKAPSQPPPVGADR